MFGCILATLLTFGTGDDHFTSLENQGCRSLGLLHSHNDGSKSLGIVFGISTLASNMLKIKLAHEIGCTDKILKLRRLVLGLLVAIMSCSGTL